MLIKRPAKQRRYGGDRQQQAAHSVLKGSRRPKAPPHGPTSGREQRQTERRIGDRSRGAKPEHALSRIRNPSVAIPARDVESGVSAHKDPRPAVLPFKGIKSFAADAHKAKVSNRQHRRNRDDRRQRRTRSPEATWYNLARLQTHGRRRHDGAPRPIRRLRRRAKSPFAPRKLRYCRLSLRESCATFAKRKATIQSVRELRRPDRRGARPLAAFAVGLA